MSDMCCTFEADAVKEYLRGGFHSSKYIEASCAAISVCNFLGVTSCACHAMCDLCFIMFLFVSIFRVSFAVRYAGLLGFLRSAMKEPLCERMQTKAESIPK